MLNGGIKSNFTEREKNYQLFFSIHKTLCLISRSKRTWVRNVPALDGREGDQNPLLLSLTPTQDRNKGQVLSVVYSTYYKQLKFRRKKQSSWRPGGCSDWLSGESKALPGRSIPVGGSRGQAGSAAGRLGR